MSDSLVVRARRIVTMAGTDVAAFATVAGRVVATGDAAVLTARFPDAGVVDLGDAVVVPGLHDAHMHPSMTAEDLLHADLSPAAVRSKEQLLDALRRQAATTPPGRWVRGSRYDHVKTTGGAVIDRADLDAVSTEHPILVVHVAAHWGVANSAALAAGGIDEDTPPPEGGDFGWDAAGHLNGVLYEQALFDYANAAAARRPVVVPESDLEDLLGGLDRAQRMFHAAGLTTVGDAMVGPTAWRLFGEAERRGRLSLRVDMLLTHHHFDHVEALGLRSGFGGDRLRFAGVKAFVDGAVAGGTCLLEQPYEGTHDHGRQTMATADLREVVRRVHGAGTRLAVHANGDRAINLVLDAYEAAHEADPRPDLHHRIEHCTVVDDAILARMKALHVGAAPFGSYVAFHGDKLVGWYGEQRLERMFAHRSFLDAGVVVAGSSDYPCGPYEPLLALQSCVTRRSAEGQLLGGSQRVTPQQALGIYTVGSATAAGRAGRLGRLAPGYLADFTVLGDDPRTCDPDAIAEIAVRSTWVGAERVWSEEDGQ